MADDGTIAIVAVLWALFLLSFVLWCLSCCCFSLCCPAKVSRCFAYLTFLLVITAVLVTALLTHELNALANGTREAAELSFRGAKFIAGVAVAQHHPDPKPVYLHAPRMNNAHP